MAINKAVGLLFTAGTISHLQIDNVVRSQAYIAAYVSGAVPPVVAGQTDLCLPLNEGAGTGTAGDTSGNSHNGTLSSATMWVP